MKKKLFISILLAASIILNLLEFFANGFNWIAFISLLLLVIMFVSDFIFTPKK